MATKPLKRPRDPLALAKLIGDIATGQVADAVEDRRDPVAVHRGSKGGARGGKKRAIALSPQRRQEIARKAALARWGSSPQEKAAKTAVRGKKVHQ